MGLIYGPSGCGKSSLVKAGLLPRLASDVIAVYVEATAEETELRLLNRLRRRCPDLDANLDLTATLAALRRGQGTAVGKKVLIVLDQFEQWLHAKRHEQNTDLVAALRQCDGSRVQCVVLVRDDFWLAVSRFLKDLEVRLVEGQNSALVDLFDRDHARRVLAAFGRAFDRLPEHSRELTAPQAQFLDQAVTGLAQDGKVICVRLALFAEMMKGKPWTPASLKAVGGTEGLGMTFLEETFGAHTAPLRHRQHATAAPAVLKSLLPEQGTEIRGSMRSAEQLQEASGYSQRSSEFAELLAILDGELRLITPTDPEGFDSSSLPLPPGEGGGEGMKFYQLTHDYLVPSLRAWLTRKQRETRRGRAELRLAERAALWNVKPENRHLPSWWEFLNIRCLTRPKDWKDPERTMMQRAGRFHLIRAGVLLVLLSLLGWVVYEANGTIQAAALANSLRTAKEDAVLDIIDRLQPYRRWANTLLKRQLAREPKSAENQRAQLHVRMALLHEDVEQAEVLKDALLDPGTAYSYVGVLRDALRPYRGQFTGEFRETLRKQDLPAERRFRAALALAEYEPVPDGWTDDDNRFTAEQLVAANPEYQPMLREYLRQIGDQLVAPLEVLFRNPELPEGHLSGAANALAVFAGQDGDRLASLLTVATPTQYRILYDRFEKLKQPGARDWLVKLANVQPAQDLPSEERVDLGKRRAGAAITLLRQGLLDEMLAALRVQDDPESLTQFVHRCRERDVRPQELLAALETADKQRQGKTGVEREVEDRVLFGLLLALGEFSPEELSAAQRKSLVDGLAEWYRSDPSSAIHGATGWLLRQWNREDLARQVDDTAVAYSADRQWYTVEVPSVREGSKAAKKRVYMPVDGVEWSERDGGNAPEERVCMTFVVFPAGQYAIGSPPDEPERESDETRHQVRITRAFAVSDREVTWSEYSRFDGGSHRDAWAEKFKKPVLPDAPAFGVSWFEAVAYCRWLTSQCGMSEVDQAYDGKPLEDKLESRPGWVGFPDSRNSPDWPVRLDRCGFRLPTEAEWEIACRSGTVTAYSYGGDERLLVRYGWFVDNSARWSRAVGYQRPNLRGLLDMHGNVWEWCHDWYGTSVDDVVDPTGREQGSIRVARGGSWCSRAGYCRSAHRVRFSPGYRINGLGFRVARSSSGK